MLIFFIMARNLLLISNSKSRGGGFLDHAEASIREVLEEANAQTVLFIPYARPGGRTWDEYTALVRERFKQMGFDLRGIHEYDSPTIAEDEAQAFFVGGGNTWQLLHELEEDGGEVLDYIKEDVEAGAPYIGSSAGANLAGVSIRMTNDKPVREVVGTEGLCLVPFIINPHYLDTIQLTPEERDAVLRAAPQLQALLDYRGETRDDQIREFHALGNTETVVALREGSMIRVVDNSAKLLGYGGARVFSPGKDPTEHKAGESLDFLLQSGS